jgi:hypothetical protein
MIKLTPAQQQSLAALARLERETGLKRYFPVSLIRDRRIVAMGKEDPSDVYLRTTANALERINEIVPSLLDRTKHGYRLTAAGQAVAETQLGVRREHAGP